MVDIKPTPTKAIRVELSNLRNGLPVIESSDGFAIKSDWQSGLRWTVGNGRLLCYVNQLRSDGAVTMTTPDPVSKSVTLSNNW